MEIELLIELEEILLFHNCGIRRGQDRKPGGVQDFV
jgi:hypothetical protein